MLKIGQNIKYDMRRSWRALRHRDRADRRHHADLLRARRRRPRPRHGRAGGAASRPQDDQLRGGRRQRQDAGQLRPRCRSTRRATTPPRTPTSRCASPGAEAAAVAEQLVTVYETIERPLVPVVADMERAGHQGRPRDAAARCREDFAERWPSSRARSTSSPAHDVQHRLAQAAGRGAVRRDGLAGRQEGQDRRLWHRRRRAGGAGGPGPSTAGARARLAPARQAQEHLYRRAGRADQSRDRPRPHLLRAAGAPRPGGCPRPIPICRTSRPHRGGPQDPPRLRRRARA